MSLWIREIKLTAGDKEFSSEAGFNIEFNVPFSISQDPDIADIELINITDDSIAAINSKAYVILNAGYKGDFGSILVGNVEEISTRWSGVDKITKIKVSDGGIEWREARVNKTYQSGTTAKYIMQDLASILGLEVGEIEPAEDLTYKLGKTINGKVNAALKQLAADTKSKMYISKDKLYIRKDGKGTETGFLLNSNTGLINSPERLVEEDDRGNSVVKYNIECLLNHKISADSVIKVESRAVNGYLRVESGVHMHNGTDFITEITAIPM